MSSVPIDDPRETREKYGKASVSGSIMDFVNDIYDGGVVANLRTGPLVPSSICRQMELRQLNIMVRLYYCIGGITIK